MSSAPSLAASEGGGESSCLGAVAAARGDADSEPLLASADDAAEFVRARSGADGLPAEDGLATTAARPDVVR